MNFHPRWLRRDRLRHLCRDDGLEDSFRHRSRWHFRRLSLSWSGVADGWLANALDVSRGESVVVERAHQSLGGRVRGRRRRFELSDPDIDVNRRDRASPI